MVPPLFGVLPLHSRSTSGLPGLPESIRDLQLRLFWRRRRGSISFLDSGSILLSRNSMTRRAALSGPFFAG